MDIDNKLRRLSNSSNVNSDEAQELYTKFMAKLEERENILIYGPKLDCKQEDMEDLWN